MTVAAGPSTPICTGAYDTGGRAIEVCDTIMSADAYVLGYTLPAR